MVTADRRIPVGFKLGASFDNVSCTKRPGSSDEIQRAIDRPHQVDKGARERIKLENIQMQLVSIAFLDFIRIIMCMI